jgi:hypothetical protein
MNENLSDSSGSLKKSRLKTIAKFQYLPLAELAKIKLESEGILCFLQDKNMVGINWMYSNAIGGVKLQVPVEHEDIAKKILDKDCSAELDMVEEEFSTIGNSGLCKKCNSPNLTIINSTRTAGAWSLLLGIPFIFFRKRYKCTDCHHIMKMGR